MVPGVAALVLDEERPEERQGPKDVGGAARVVGDFDRSGQVREGGRAAVRTRRRVTLEVGVGWGHLSIYLCIYLFWWL